MLRKPNLETCFGSKILFSLSGVETRRKRPRSRMIRTCRSIKESPWGKMQDGRAQEAQAHKVEFRSCFLQSEVDGQHLGGLDQRFEKEATAFAFVVQQDRPSLVFPTGPTMEHLLIRPLRSRAGRWMETCRSACQIGRRTAHVLAKATSSLTCWPMSL